MDVTSRQLQDLFQLTCLCITNWEWPFGSSLCPVLQPHEIAFSLMAPWTRSWKPSPEILPNQSCGEHSHANHAHLGTFHARSVQLDPRVLFLLRERAVSMPETQTDFLCLLFHGLCSLEPLEMLSEPLLLQLICRYFFSPLALNKNRSVVSNLLCNDFTIFCQI